jgi:hypothetical protein
MKNSSYYFNIHIYFRIKTKQTIEFADLVVSKHKVKEEFFNQINQVLDWKPIEKLINSHYHRFRTVLTEAKVYDRLWILINKQLESYGIVVRTGALH